MENFEVKGKLGSGSFSNVFKVVNQKDQKTYAMKKVKMSSLSAKDRQNAINEVWILASIQHENIISYKEEFYEQSSSCLCIIMEFAEGGDLLKTVEKAKISKVKLPEKLVWKYLI